MWARHARRGPISLLVWLEVCEYFYGSNRMGQLRARVRVLVLVLVLVRPLDCRRHVVGPVWARRRQVGARSCDSYVARPAAGSWPAPNCKLAVGRHLWQLFGPFTTTTCRRRVARCWPLLESIWNLSPGSRHRPRSHNINSMGPSGPLQRRTHLGFRHGNSRLGPSSPLAAIRCGRGPILNSVILRSQLSRRFRRRSPPKGAGQQASGMSPMGRPLRRLPPNF